LSLVTKIGVAAGLKNEVAPPDAQARVTRRYFSSQEIKPKSQLHILY
jgi:hypothetical protein